MSDENQIVTYGVQKYFHLEINGHYIILYEKDGYARKDGQPMLYYIVSQEIFFVANIGCCYTIHHF